MTELCRICLRPFQTDLEVLNSKNMFNNFVEDQSYSQIYEFCIGFCIRADDLDLPMNICEECERNLLNSFTFKYQCLKTEEFLKNIKENETVQAEKSIQNKDELYTKQPGASFEFLSVNMKYDTIETVKTVLEEDCDKLITETEQAKTNSEIILIQEDVGYQVPVTVTEKSESSIINSENEIAAMNDARKMSVKKRRRKGSDGSSVCPICGREFKGKTLRLHLITHENQPVERSTFVCDVCGKSFRYKGGLTVHKKAAHIKEKTYNCPVCQETFDAQYKRRYHVLKYHCGEYKYQCQICQHTCITAGVLKKHMRTHTGEAPPRNFKCTFESCNRAFECPAKLKIHCAATHLGERIFKCDLCDKTYVDPKSLKYHRQSIHIGEKNYICPICPAAYFKNLVLRSHITKAHPQYDLPPPGTSLALKK